MKISHEGGDLFDRLGHSRGGQSATGSSDVDLSSDLDNLSEGHSESFFFMSGIAIHVGEDRLGNAIEFRLVFHHDRLMPDVI